MISKSTKAYLMVLAVTFAGSAACWYILTQINHLPDDAESVAALPFRHSVSPDTSKLPSAENNINK